MIKALFLLILLKFNLFYSQLVTSTTSNFNHLMTHYFDNSNSIFNVQYTGSNSAIGSYDASNTNLNISKGIVMTTGKVMGNDSPQGPNNDDGSGIDNGFGGTDLLSPFIGNIETYNASKLEFDFVVLADSFFIDYIFGSEEYLEYVDSEFKDMVVIMISGAGIPGKKNIATLPSSQFVSVNKINNISNSQYYVNNGNGNETPFNTDSVYIQYDGYTTLLRASSATQQGFIYHVEIIIADVSDGLFDSGVFLSTNSFGYTGLKENSSYNEFIFPNPSSGFVNFKDLDLSQVTKIELIDQLGNIVGDFEIQKNLNLQEFKNGLYTIRITTKDSVKQDLIQLNR